MKILKIIGILILPCSIVFAFIDPLKSLAFSAIYFLCAISDIQVNGGLNDQSK